MFKFLKDKIKGAIGKLSKQVDEEGAEEVIEKQVDVPTDSSDASAQKTAPSKVKKPKKAETRSKSEAVVKESGERDDSAPKLKERSAPKGADDEATSEKHPKKSPKKKARLTKEESESAQKGGNTPISSNTSKSEDVPGEASAEKKKGFFSRITEKITTKKIDEGKFDDLFWDLELALLENNVAVQVIEKIKADLKGELVDKPIARGKIEQTIFDTLQKSVQELFVVPSIDLLKLSDEKRPLVVCLIGINGSGKTTTIAKLTKMFQDSGKSVVLAAADTFRAAAIDQLQIHADNLGVKLIRHDYGSDAAAVAYDAIEHAKAKGKDVVLIDTAGRIHSNTNLIDEMKKIIRVAKPDLKIFVGESITGNDCVEQALKFDEAVGLDGIILSKADIDEKGGAAVSVSYVTRKPILFLGTGQEYSDLTKFDSDEIMKQLFA